MSDKFPSFREMLSNFSRDLFEYAKAGAPNVNEDTYKARLQECDACPHLKRDEMRCGLCGCYIEHKAKWRTSNCPDDRWKKANIDDRENNTAKDIDKTQSPDQ